MSAEGVGLSANEVDAAAPSEDTVAEYYGVDIEEPKPATVDDEEIDLTQLVLQQARTIERLEERIDELEGVEQRVDELERGVEEATENAKKARSSTKEMAAMVAKGDTDDDTEGETAQQDGPQPATSLLDLYANVEQPRVEEKVSANKARAVEIARRNDEFGQVGRSNGRVLIRREDVREALKVIMNTGTVHRQTANRVYDYINDLGRSDVFEGKIQGDDSRVGLVLEPHVAERFREGRYVGMDLLAESNGGVTPVVTGSNHQEV